MAKLCPITGGYTVYLTCKECEEKPCKTSTLKNLFIDMDGTIAKFYDDANCLEKMYEPGFFRNLKKYHETIDALQGLKDIGNLYIISAVHADIWDQVVSEKMEWLAEAGLDFPTSQIIFVPFGADKAGTAELILGRKLSKNDILLDDYNKNLAEWSERGGESVKFVNEINNKGKIGPVWKGFKVWHDDAKGTESLLRTLLTV